MKTEQVAASLGKAPTVSETKKAKKKKNDGTPGNLPYGLSASKHAFVRRACEGHRVLPSLESRKDWAKLNGVSYKLVSGCIKARTRVQPDTPASREPWKMPMEVITDQDVEVIVKEESKDENIALPVPLKIKKEDEELFPKAEASTSSTFRSSPEPVVQDIVPPASNRPLPPHADVSPTLASHSSPLQSMAPVNPLVFAISSGQDAASFVPPWIIDPVNDFETMKFLINSNFFDLTKGPHGIRLADMTDPTSFKAKLALMNSPFDEGFAWKALKRFYFCF